MTALIDWAGGALLGSTVLMLVVLAARGPVRHWLGPRFGYALWALPAIRMVVPPLPAGLFVAGPGAATMVAKVLVVGTPGAALWAGPATAWTTGTVLLATWLAGAGVLLGWQIARHARFRRRLLASARPFGCHGSIRIVAAAVEGPLAFGVLERYVAVPTDFADRYSAREQALALAHEVAHHARGDLVANWAALAVLAAHWWNPVAWAAIRALRDDQEFAVDADVLAHSPPDARPVYAHVLARAAGLGTLAICPLNPRSNLKGRLTMLAQKPVTARRLMFGGSTLTLVAATALAATMSAGSAAAPPAGRQAVTIGVKPDGTGGYALIVGGAAVAPGAALPGGATLPADFDPAGGCDLKASAKPIAMVIKGFNGITTYTVMCASAAPAPVHATLDEGLASLKTMRGSVASQPASKVFPETERRHALGAVDRSIGEVEATLATNS